MDYKLVAAVLTAVIMLLVAALVTVLVRITCYRRKSKRELKIEARPIVEGLCWVFRDALEKGKDWNLALGAWQLHSEAWARRYPKDEEAITEAVRLFAVALRRMVDKVQYEEALCSRGAACTRTAERILAETWSPAEEAERPGRGKVNLTALDNNWNSLALFITHRR